VYQAKYFKPSEFRCKCSRCKDNPDPVMTEKQLKLLDSIREEANEQVYVTCGHRCEKHNREVGGVENSYHTQEPCLASDIWCKGKSVRELARIAIKCGADGVGRYFEKNFVHVDSRGCKARWDE
jgi:uncharacterized protein YcbK (DUF882 family)